MQLYAKPENGQGAAQQRDKPTTLAPRSRLATPEWRSTNCRSQPLFRGRAARHAGSSTPPFQRLPGRCGIKVKLNLAILAPLALGHSGHSALWVSGFTLTGEVTSCEAPRLLASSANHASEIRDSRPGSESPWPRVAESHAHCPAQAAVEPSSKSSAKIRPFSVRTTAQCEAASNSACAEPAITGRPTERVSA